MTTALLSKQESGFTVIELIVALVVIGILSAFVMARFLGVDAYNAITIRDQVMSMAQAAQQRAIGRSNVQLVLQPVAADLEIRVQDSNGVVQSVRTSASSVTLAADINNQASCAVSAATPLGGAASLVLNYNGLGDLVDGGMSNAAGFPLEISTGARICVDNNPAMSVCVSAAGFAYVGNCIE